MLYKTSYLLALCPFRADALLPPGITSGIAAARQRDNPLIVNLHAPEEAPFLQAIDIDAVLRSEKAFHAGEEAGWDAQKQRILNNEIAKIGQMVARRRSSFLSVPKADYQVVLHEPDEGSADVQEAVNSILKVESQKLKNAEANFVADKAALLRSELAKIHRDSFLEPLNILATQTAWQAALPDLINIHYTVPGGTPRDEFEAFRRTSFLQDLPSADVYFEKDPLPTAQEARYQELFSKVKEHIRDRFEALTQGRAAFFEQPEFDVSVAKVDSAHALDKVDLERLRADALQFASSLVLNEE